TGACLKTFQGESRSRAVAFGPEARWLALAGPDHGIGLWDTATGKRLQSFRGHTATVLSVAVSPDGTRLVSFALDKSLRLWDVVSGRELWQRPAEAPWTRALGI